VFLSASVTVIAIACVGRIVDVHGEQLESLTRPGFVELVEGFQVFLAGG